MKQFDEIEVEQGSISADPARLCGNRNKLFKTFMIIYLEIQIKLNSFLEVKYHQNEFKNKKINKPLN